MKILITGTSSGIGKGCAEFFLKKGHEVYGFDKNTATITVAAQNFCHKFSKSLSKTFWK